MALTFCAKMVLQSLNTGTQVVCYVCGLQTYSHQYNHYMFVVLVICFLYLVLTMLTFTIRVIPHYYLPVSINNIVSNFLAEGLPALCPTG